MLKIAIALAVIATAGSAWAQELSIPSDAPTTHKFNKKAEAMPGEKCSSQNQQCVDGCQSQRRMNEQARCLRDCEERLSYCKRTGFYLWIRSPSIQVGSKD